MNRLPLSHWRDELRSFVVPGPRMADEAACVASVLLAVVLAHAIGARMVGWAAFTAFVLLKGPVAETVLRGVMRLAGTIAGAALGLALVPASVDFLPLAMVVAALAGAIGLYGMMTARRAYAWFLFGLTLEMILLDRLDHPGLDTFEFARTRVLEVAAGTVACVAVSVTARLLAGREWRQASPPPARLGWHPHAARHAAQAGIALALLVAINALFPLAELAQAGVTIMAVMIVPVAGLGASGLVPVTRRLAHRAVGCLGGGALALVVVLVAQGDPVILVAGTALGIIIGRHIENGHAAMAYVGVQFTLTVMVVLIPDHYDHVAIAPAIARLASIAIGMAILEPVLLAWHWIAPAMAAPEKVTTGESE